MRVTILQEQENKIQEKFGFVFSNFYILSIRLKPTQ